MSIKKKKEKTQRPKPIGKFSFIQDWGTYQTRTPVFVGFSDKEITKALERMPFSDKFLTLWKKDLERDWEPHDRINGYFWSREGCSVLSLATFEDTWFDLDTINHECFHAVMFILASEKKLATYDYDTKEIDFEHEGLAYAHEYLVRSIRTKLQDEFWRKGRKGG